MSVQAITWAFNQNVTPAGLKFVLVALANYASEDGYCYPSQKTLAKLTGQSERAVRGHLSALEAEGYIRREERRKSDGGRISDGFHLEWTPRQILPVPLHPPAESAGTPRQLSPYPPADSAANTKERDTKEDTKEDSVPPTILRVREHDARQQARRKR